MVLIFRLENVVLNFGLYKIGKQDYQILNYSSVYKENTSWMRGSREYAHIQNRKEDLKYANERLLIKPYAKIISMINSAIENGNIVIFVSALNEDFCKDFLQQMNYTEQSFFHSVDKIEVNFLEKEISNFKEERICVISGDLEEVSSLSKSDDVFAIAALWGTTEWLEKDFLVDAVLESVGETEKLWMREDFDKQQCGLIDDKIQSKLRIFKKEERRVCIREIFETLKRSGFVEDWEWERKKVEKKCIFPCLDESLEEATYGLSFIDGLRVDWNNPFLPYITISIETLKYYIAINLKTRKGFLNLYLQETNYINYISENGKVVNTPGKGSDWTAREIALLKYYIRHKEFEKKQVEIGYRGKISDLLCLLPGRTEDALFSKMNELGLHFRIKSEK